MASVGKRMECAGVTPSLLIQTNNCYWEQSCNINWKGPAKVTLTESPGCLGRKAAILSTTAYSCIRQDNVINMCSRYKPELVDKEVGIIRSHNIYPWDYGAESVDCRKVIKIGEGKQLLLRLEAAEVDEDRDTFRIIHTKVNTHTLVVKGNTKRFNATLSEGVVEIYLTVSGRSKTGKGFILYFEKIGETAQKNSDIVKISSKRNHKQREIRRKRKRRGQSGDNNRQRMNKKRKSKKSKKKFRKSNKDKTKRSRRIKKTKTHRRKTRI